MYFIKDLNFLLQKNIIGASKFGIKKIKVLNGVNLERGKWVF